MISSEIARVVLSGSFRRDQTGLASAYNELVQTMCQVLSPHRLQFDDAEFVRDDAEQTLDVKTIENHQLMSIKQADFIWLHAPKGYVGNSAALEIGYALAIGVPVFTKSQIEDIMIREYVTVCSSVYEAKRQVLDRV